MSMFSSWNPWATYTLSLKELNTELRDLLNKKKAKPDEISEVANSILTNLPKCSSLDSEQFQTLLTNIKQLKSKPTADALEVAVKIAAQLKFDFPEEEVSDGEGGPDDWTYLLSKGEQVAKEKEIKENESIAVSVVAYVMKSVLAKADKVEVPTDLPKVAKSEPTKEKAGQSSIESDAKTFVHKAQSRADPKAIADYLRSLAFSREFINLVLPPSYIDQLLKDTALNLTTEMTLSINGKKLCLNIPTQFFLDCARTSLKFNQKLISESSNIFEDLMHAIFKPPLNKMITRRFIEKFGNNIQLALNLMKLINQAALAQPSKILTEKYFKENMDVHVVYQRVFDVNIYELRSPEKDRGKDLIKVRYKSLFSIKTPEPETIYYYVWLILDVTINKEDLHKGTTTGAIAVITQSPLLSTEEEAWKYSAANP